MSHDVGTLVVILMGVAQTASVGRNLTMEYVRRVDASPREDFCERSSRNLVDDKGVFIAIFFIARRAGKATTPYRFYTHFGFGRRQRKFFPDRALRKNSFGRRCVPSSVNAVAGM